jgi:hypothetical protein
MASHHVTSRRHKLGGGQFEFRTSSSNWHEFIRSKYVAGTVLEQTLLVTRPLPFFHAYIIRTTNWVKFLYREEYHKIYFNYSLKYFSLSSTHLATAVPICRLTSDLQEQQHTMLAGITCLQTFDTKIIYSRVEFLVPR